MSAEILGLLLAVAAALATFVGWAIAASRRSWPLPVFGWTMLLSGVAMLAISSLNLLPTAWDSGIAEWHVVALVAIGAAIVIVLRVIAERLERPKTGKSLQRTALIAAVAIGLHNVPEGAAPVGATLVSIQSGVIVALALGLHNIPEGLAISAPVLAGGGSRKRALAFTAVATGGEIAGAVIAVAFAEALTPSRAGGLLALVAGIMITLSVLELIPTGLKLIRGVPVNASQPQNASLPR